MRVRYTLGLTRHWYDIIRRTRRLLIVNTINSHFLEKIEQNENKNKIETKTCGWLPFILCM